MEIIKTDDPNIVIERTFIDKTIDLAEVSRCRDVYVEMLSDYDAKISELILTLDTISGVVRDAVSSEVQRLQGERVTYQLEVERMEGLLNA